MRGSADKLQKALIGALVIVVLALGAVLASVLLRLNAEPPAVPAAADSAVATEQPQAVDPAPIAPTRDDLFALVRGGEQVGRCRADVVSACANARQVGEGSPLWVYDCPNDQRYFVLGEVVSAALPPSVAYENVDAATAALGELRVRLGPACEPLPDGTVAFIEGMEWICKIGDVVLVVMGEGSNTLSFSLMQPAMLDGSVFMEPVHLDRVGGSAGRAAMTAPFACGGAPIYGCRTRWMSSRSNDDVTMRCADFILPGAMAGAPVSVHVQDGVVRTMSFTKRFTGLAGTREGSSFRDSLFLSFETSCAAVGVDGVMGNMTHVYECPDGVVIGVRSASDYNTPYLDLTLNYYRDRSVYVNEAQAAARNVAGGL